jgi:hypothetical protein
MHGQLVVVVGVVVLNEPSKTLRDRSFCGNAKVTNKITASACTTVQ